jgi:hypothetical protein
MNTETTQKVQRTAKFYVITRLLNATGAIKRKELVDDMGAIVALRHKRLFTGVRGSPKDYEDAVWAFLDDFSAPADPSSSLPHGFIRKCAHSNPSLDNFLILGDEDRRTAVLKLIENNDGIW